MERKTERKGYRPLLSLTFYIYVFRKFLFLPAGELLELKGQGLLKGDPGGNHVTR